MSIPILSPRVIQILTMVSNGYRQMDASQKLGISKPYMKKLMLEAYQVTGTDNITHCVAWALRNKVIQ